MFSGKSSKEQNADGSTLETKEENAAIKGEFSRACRCMRMRLLIVLPGAAAGNLNANAAADAEQKGRQMRAAIQDKNAS